MLRVDDTVLVLLAAGRSSRFGAGDNKLEQVLAGKPLGLHVADALTDMAFLERVAIVGGGRLDYGSRGFACIRNEDPASGMARSVRLGVVQAEARGARAVLIVLADMPRVTAAHVGRLFAASEDDMSVVASSDGRSGKPPALFGRGRFTGLRNLSGDAGARDLIRAGRHVIALPGELIDVDTHAELDALQAPCGHED
mgnify:CR=1 FL=1